ncbi:MAG TPA: hypothetical protein PLE19_11860 [Planctomycetota bacterium]|nr:hypothetical protein [Planctomycetota bacterium]HRR81087.1 hypothetical protein [Planctomycetota bacterium]HRT94349.1 hypothetical protein [Planctomycetota bacterium]
MARDILVFGHGDKSSKGFATAEALVEYLEGGIFRKEYGGRYRYSQRRQADVIVLSRDGWAYGHFEVSSTEAPTEKDRRAYPRVRRVYLIRKSVRYGKPVRMSDMGISRFQFGKRVTEEEFEGILRAAGRSEGFCS